MTRCASSLVLMVMCGCGGLSLDEMKAPGLLVQLSDSDLSFKRYITLREIEHEEDDCPNLSHDPRAFIDDFEVPLESPGSWAGGGILGPPPYCSPTVFRDGETELTLPGPEDVTRIRITEGDTTFIAETKGLCGPRSFRMIAPADGVLRSGSDVELEWQPATDVLLVHRVTLGTKGGTYELSLQSGTLRIEGNRMRFRLPYLRAADAGSARLSLSGDGSGAFGLYHAGPTRCEGFAECRFDCRIKNVPSSLDVTVQAE